MRSFTFALVLIVAASIADGFRVKSKARRAQAANQLVVGKAADCDALSNITVGGRNFGQAASIICRFWPEQYGEFPVQDAQTVAALMNQAGDIWRKLQELAKGSAGAPFCWKKFGMRELLETLALNNMLAMNSTVGALNDCEMEIFGKCYGDCPTGYKPTALIGGFAPVCSSECSQTQGHRTPCGFGCSSNAFNCMSTIVDQVAQVTRTVGTVSSYLLGNPAVAAVVDKVMRLVEFAINTLFKTVKVAKHVLSEWSEGEAELGLVIALVQFVVESARELGQEFDFIRNMFGETLEMILELVDAEFKWVDVDLDFIAKTILQHGSQILDGAFELTKVFIYPTCKAA